jgi:multidrug resistance efflux pump
MPNNTPTIFRSEPVNEIISNNPGFLVRNGIAIFLLFLAAILFVCSYVKYPDVIKTSAKLNAVNPPTEIKSKINGRLIKMFVTEGQQVSQNEVLCFIESNANHNEVLVLNNKLDSCIAYAKNNHIKQTIYTLHAFLAANKNTANYGELQNSYQVFSLAYQQYLQYINNGFYIQKLEMLQKDISYLSSLQDNLAKQKTMTEEDIKLMQENFKAQEKLSTQKVIAPVEFRNEKSKLINKELQIPNLNASIINNENMQHNKQKEIAELQNQIMQQHTTFLQAMQTFAAQVADWKIKYVLSSATKGTISFASFIQQNQMLQANQVFCFVTPTNSNYYAEVMLPQANFGKIKPQQKVLLKFPSYPFEQYGYVEGSIDFISNIATDSGYLSKVVFANGLQTNYAKQIVYRDGLKAQAEIITEDMSMLDRFFYNIKSSMKVK